MIKNYHHGNLRQALIQTAIPVLREKGIVGLSLRGLAKKLGVSHGAPYRHFSNKTALLQAVAATGFATLQDICRKAADQFPGDPRKQLYEAGTGYILYVARNPEIADLMFRSGLSQDASGAELQQAIDAAVGSLASIIENGKREKLYSDHETMDLVLASLSAVHGLAMFIASGMLIDPAAPRDRIEALGKRVYEILMHGMENTDSDRSP